MSTPTDDTPRDPLAALDAAYRERNALAAALIRTHPEWPCWTATAPDAPGWWIIYAETPNGQVSWHVSHDDLVLFAGLSNASGEAWDGHTTEEKYRRLAILDATRPSGDETLVRCDIRACNGEHEPTHPHVATPSSAPDVEGLDVERLARAVHTLRWCRWGDTLHALAHDYEEDGTNLRADIARAYVEDLRDSRS